MTKEKQTPGGGDFYQLTPAEFERLVAEVFAQAGYSDVRLVGGPADQGVDILATRNGQPVAVQVKHKTRLTVQELQRFTDRYFANPSTPRSLVFVTSADLPQDARRRIERIPEGAHFDIMDRGDLHQMIAAHATVSQRFMAFATERLKSQRHRLFLSAVVGILSIVGATVSIYTVVFPPKAPLDNRIETVERALASMHDLETYLADIKRDMEVKQKATTVINQKYAEAKELEKLTTAQLTALQATLQASNWRWTVFNYVIGFLLGVASSLVASVLYARWKQRKALE